MHLLRTGPAAWALVDLAYSSARRGTRGRHRRGCSRRWELVGEYPTSLSLPTLLDVDPGAARRGRPADRRRPALAAPPEERGNHTDEPACPPSRSGPTPTPSGPVTDLYQLTMMAGYAASGMADEPATFELFVRQAAAEPGLPGLRRAGAGGRRPAAAGVLGRAGRGDPRAGPRSRDVDPAFFDGLLDAPVRGRRLGGARGDGRLPGRDPAPGRGPAGPGAVGRDVPAGVARLSDAGGVEGRPDRRGGARAGRCYDFGARRGHGPHAGLLAARSAYLAGFDGDQPRRGRPAAGHPVRRARWPIPGSSRSTTEAEAFAAFARVFPGVDDAAGRHLRHARGRPPRRRDRAAGPGDPDRQRRPRRALARRPGRSSTSTAGGTVKILGSRRPRRVSDRRARRRGGARSTRFGVGTELITSRDAPALSMVYKLVELDGQGRIKLSPGKKTYPLAKQVYRRRDAQGPVSPATASPGPTRRPRGSRCSSRSFEAGQLVAPLPSLDAIRERCREQLAALPDASAGLDATRSIRGLQRRARGRGRRLASAVSVDPHRGRSRAMRPAAVDT